MDQTKPASAIKDIPEMGRHFATVSAKNTERPVAEIVIEIVAVSLSLKSFICFGSLDFM